MLDTQELKEVAKLPIIFTNGIEWEIHKAISEYDECKSYVVHALESYGGHFDYKIPKVYDKVEKAIIANEKDSMKTRKFLTVLAEMRHEYCKD